MFVFLCLYNYLGLFLFGVVGILSRFCVCMSCLDGVGFYSRFGSRCNNNNTM